MDPGPMLQLVAHQLKSLRSADLIILKGAHCQNHSDSGCCLDSLHHWVVLSFKPHKSCCSSLITLCWPEVGNFSDEAMLTALCSSPANLCHASCHRSYHRSISLVALSGNHTSAQISIRGLETLGLSCAQVNNLSWFHLSACFSLSHSNPHFPWFKPCSIYIFNHWLWQAANLNPRPGLLWTVHPYSL